jgi:hypothetical protein
MQVPSPRGPRQPGQFPDGVENAAAATSNTVRQHTTGLFFLMMVSSEVPEQLLGISHIKRLATQPSLLIPQ